MKLAVVGTGISGALVARLAHASHDVTVFEADARIGGHTHTVDVELDGARYAIDTGFIVFNDWTYPNFIRLLEHLDVPSQPSDMSFSVSCARTGLEYCGSTINALFAQRRNFFRPSFHRMVRDILRFNREAPRLLDAVDDDPMLGEYLARGRYSSAFLDHYILPMGGAIWSADARQMLHFPARSFVRFFDNHGMLSVDERPQWRTIRGGSSTYMRALVAPFAHQIRCDSPIDHVRRFDTHVEVGCRGRIETFDRVVIATHSDSALRMLVDASEAERSILGAIPYQENVAVLHTDARVMPKRKLAWASWNHHAGTQVAAGAPLTYWMNRLQDLRAPHEFFVTLNDVDRIDPRKVLRTIRYHHPVFTRAGIAAQARHAEISGVRRTSYCGAYFGFGFHEDGVKSALAVAREFGLSLDDLRRATSGDEVAA